MVKGVGGKGSERLLNQLIQVLEADGGILAQGLAVTLHALLDVVVNGERADTLPLEKAPCKLTDALETPDAPEWEELLEALRRHRLASSTRTTCRCWKRWLRFTGLRTRPRRR